MKKHIRRALALAVCLMMVIGTMAPYAFAENETSGSVQADGNDLNITKSVTAKNDGTYELKMEAFATGTSQTTTVSKPLDIVLVLDVSGSMDEVTRTRTYTAQERKSYSYNSIDNSRTQYYYKDSNGQYYPVYADYDWHLFSPNEYYIYYRTGNRGHLIGKVVNSKTDAIYTGVLYTATTIKAKKLDSMKAAAKKFVNTVAADAKDSNVDHRIAVVKFAGTKSDEIGNYLYNEGRYNYSQTVEGLTDVKAGAADLNRNIDALKAGGATHADYGMQLANGLLSGTSADRQKVVVMFTDGEPTSHQNFEDDVANGAISAAKTMKDAGAAVYTVGMIADPSDDVRDFLDYTSSNYPDATSMLNHGDKVKNSYSTIVTDGSGLDDVFQKIASEAVSSTATADETSLLKDTLSSYFKFKMNEDGTLADCKVEKVPCTGENKWGNPDDITKDVKVEKDGKNIQISGYDYTNEENLVVKKSDESWQGYKLVLTFSIVPDTAAEWQTGTNNYPTNETVNSKAGIYNSESSELLTLDESPKAPVTAYAVTYTDGVDDEVVFADQVYTVLPGTATPGFNGTPARGGYKFAGWQPTVADTVTDNATYTAQWEPVTPAETFTVTYKDGRGGMWFADEVYSGLKAGAATPAYSGDTPEHEGYNFIGWTPEVADKVTGNATYTAQWESKSERLIKDLLGNIKVKCINENSGHVIKEYDTSVGGYSAVTMESSDGKYTSTITVNASGYVEKYNDDINVKHRLADGEEETRTIVVEFDSSYNKDNVTVKSGTLPVVFKVTCAEAEPEQKYTVTYTDGVEGEEIFKDQVYSDLVSGAKTPAFNGTPVRKDYKFVGWYPEVAETVTGNATYTAKWEYNGYIPPVDPTPTTGTLTVTKTVTGFEVLPEGYNVTITVKQGDKVIKTATLSSFTDGKATYSFYGLTAGTYTVSETAADVDGYKLEATADQSVTVTAGGTATAAFVNAYTKVEEPVTPDDPENPDVPDKPEKPEKPSKPETPKDNAVKTGDTTNTGIAWGVFGAALLGLGGFAVRRRKASK